MKFPKKNDPMPQAVAAIPKRSIISLMFQPRTSLNLSKYKNQNTKYAPLLIIMKITCVKNAARNSMLACRLACQRARRNFNCFIVTGTLSFRPKGDFYSVCSSFLLEGFILSSVEGLVERSEEHTSE